MIKVLLACILVFSSDRTFGSSIDAVLKNNKSLKEFSQDKKSEAYDILSNAVVEHPNEAALSYNLGQVLESTEDKEKAFQFYNSASKVAEEAELKFMSLFNAARIAGDLKKRDEALRLYQGALDIKPDSQETKTNIELLMANSGGGGGGDNQDQQKQDKGDQEKKQEPKGDDEKKDDQPKSKPTPRPFQSKELNQQDVKKILEELKRQEEGVRAKFNNKYRKETPVEKDW